MTCALDSLGQLTLMLCASAGHAARKDLAALGHVSLELGNILIINRIDLIYTEGANLSAATTATIRTIFSFFFSHCRNLLIGIC